MFMIIAIEEIAFAKILHGKFTTLYRKMHMNNFSLSLSLGVCKYLSKFSLLQFALLLGGGCKWVGRTLNSIYIDKLTMMAYCAFASKYQQAETIGKHWEDGAMTTAASAAVSIFFGNLRSSFSLCRPNSIRFWWHSLVTVWDKLVLKIGGQ